MFGGYFPFNFVENSRIHGIIYGREKSMQLYETIEYPQPSNTVICRGKLAKSSQQIKQFNAQRYVAFRESGDSFSISGVEYS